MSRLGRVLLVLSCVCVTAQRTNAASDPPLVPDGEPADILKGATWSPLVGLRYVAASPDGYLLASVADDGMLRVWDGISGREQHRYPADSVGQSYVVFSGDGKKIAVAGKDGSISVWDVTGNPKEPSVRIKGDGSTISALALDKDGHTVFAARARKPAAFWRADTQQLQPLLTDSGEARALRLSPDGKTLAVGLTSKAVRILDTDSFKVVKTFTGFGSPPTSIAYSSNGKQIAVGTDSGAVQLALLNEGKAEARVSKTIDAHAQSITGVRFVVDDVLATTAQDATIRLWNIETSEELRRLNMEGGCCTSLATTVTRHEEHIEPRTLVATSSRAILRRDVTSGLALPELVGPSSPVLTVAISGDGKSFVAGTLDGTLRLFDVSTGQAKQAWFLGTAVRAAAVSDDGKTVFAALGSSVVAWDDTGKELHRLEGHEGDVISLALSADGLRLASGSSDHTIRVWDAAKGTQIVSFQLNGPVSAVSVSKEGARIVGIAEGGVHEFAIDKESEIRKFSVDGTPASVALSADGKRLAVGLTDGNVRVFDAEAGTPVPKLAVNVKGRVTGVAFTADVKRLLVASSSGTLHLWTTEGAGSEVGALDGLELGATCLSLSGTDEVAVGTGEGAIHLWRIQGQVEDGLYRQAAAGWLSIQKDKVVRGEGGRWVVHPDGGDGKLMNVPPKGATVAKADLKTEVVRSVQPVEGSKSGTGQITFKVTNASTITKAYWVYAELGTAVAPAAQSLTIVPSAVINKIDPGQSVELTLGLGWVTRAEKDSPHPRAETVSLRIYQVGGDTPVQQKIMVQSPQVTVSVTEIEDPKDPFVRMHVQNTGDESTGPLTLSPVFVDKEGKTLFKAPTIQVPDMRKNESTTFGVAADTGGQKKMSLDGASLQLTATATAWPTEQWKQVLPLTHGAGLPWKWIIVGFLLTFGSVGLIVGLRVLRHPVVIQVTRDPMELTKYAITRLPEVNKALVRAQRLRDALTAAKISEARWKRAVSAGRSAAEAATAFAEAIGAKKPEQPVAPGFNAWPLEMPQLDIRFPRRTAVVICTGAGLEGGAAANIGFTLHANGEGPTAAIALDLTAEQNCRAALQAVPRVSFVVLTQDQALAVLLSKEPLVVLQKIISSQRPVAELSPYQMSSGVEEEGMFFGRDRELRTIADRVLHNFIIVAPRQMGKSSLLKAINRRLATRQDVEVHYLTLFEDDLATRVGRALNRPKPETADQFVEIAGGSRRKPRVWLIDEADSFIVKDAKNKYPLAQAMRTLSEEGRAFFVLAGFWHLYAAAFLNPNNPLRNFGEMLRLEPLERDAAWALATKPMDLLGLEWEQDALVDRLLRETACRAHLIVAVCKGMIDRLGADDRVITAAHLEQGLVRNPAVADEFKHWRREPLGRALLRAAFIGGPPTRAELRERLATFGLETPNEFYSAALDRLELGFLLVANAEGNLICPVPLLQRFIEMEGAIDVGLKRDIRDFLTSQAAPERPAAQPAPAAPPGGTNPKAPAPGGTNPTGSVAPAA